MDHLDRAREVVAAAMARPAVEREAFIRAACAGDDELLLLVHGLIASAPSTDPPSQTSSVGPSESAIVKALEAAAARIGAAAGERVGPYKLLSRIGEGGFGEVWLAERREPFVQRVAIKFIKPGMDTRAVLARFEQERQALAVMDHPSVAKVLDGGVTPPEMGSRPYFVMEHVKGEPITVFCDRQRLSIRERLELFIHVCEAVQHAHMKGIIHRDIKPSNVLVANVDTNPERSEGQPATGARGVLVKVIDFGVAKAISQSMTDKTIFTEQGRMIGTPEYMSPEQAEMGGTDIDTRTDVYSLGVLLYELLVGELPFDRQSLRAAAHAEMLRIIREVEPPKPSTRLSTADDATGTEIARKRQSERDSLARELRRELEWVPLKAMRKDRRERYRSPADLADDVGRFLRGEALEAGPEGVGYQLGKLLRRHRQLVRTTFLVACVIVTAVVRLQLARAAHRETQGRAAMTSAFRTANSYARTALFDESWTEALSVYDTSLRMTKLYPHLGELALELAEVHVRRARALIALGREQEAAEGTEDAESFLTVARPANPGDPHPATIELECRCMRSRLAEQRGDFDAAETLLKGVLTDSKSRGSLQYADFLRGRGRLVEAEELLVGIWPQQAGFSISSRFQKARTAGVISELCEARGATDAAFEWRKRAVHVLLGPNSTETAPSP